MKLLASILLSALIFSTYAYIHSPQNQEYKDSLKLWKSLSLKDYSYTAFTSSGDITTTTTITVKNGKVVKREFTREDQSEVYFDEETGKDYWKTDSWVEDTPQKLRSHSQGFLAITLDAVYDQCGKNILIQDAVRNTVLFGAENNGLISECTYYELSQSDGDAIGVYISSIKY